MSDLREVLPDAPPAWPIKEQSPAVLDRRTLCDLRERLVRLHGQPLSRWLKEAPLVPRIDERAGQLELDRSIAADLGALEAVCARPRSHLSYQIDRVPAGRVRRAPPRALAHLAAHTEDWDGTTLLGVKPRRLLAEQREEILDRYENRVTARLIDHLERYLRQRRCEVAQVLGVLDEFQRAQDEAAQGSHHRKRRLFTLFSQSIDGDLLRERALRTQAELQSLWRRVAGLRGTALYLAIPPRAQVGATLRMTNVLCNDPLYLRVARLYLAWQRTAPEPTEDERRAEEEAAAAGFDEFGLLVLLRALEQLRYRPTKTQIVRAGEDLNFSGPAGGAMLSWRPGEAVLTGENGHPLRVVTLPISLVSTPAAGAEAMDMALRSLPAQTLVLHLGSVKDLALPEAQRALLLGLKRAKLAPVSPWDLSSVERVARILRSILFTPLFLSYPPELDEPPARLRDLIDGESWLRGKSKGKGFTLVRAPNGGRWRGLLDERGTKLRAELEEAQAAERAAQETRGSSKDDRRALGRANLGKTLATQRVRETQSRVEEYDQFVASLHQAEVAMERLRCCPVCGEAGQRLENHGGDFRCRCESCKSTFGTGRCRCGQRFAVLWPGSAWPSPEGTSEAVDWIDRLAGCDVLTLPCRVAHGDEPRYQCPACGACPDCE